MTDRRARFEALALPQLDAVYRTAYYLAGSVAEAEDLTQETYLRAFKHFESFRGDHVRPWLFAILRHAAVDRYRQRKREPLLFDDDPDGFADDAFGGSESGPEDEVLAGLVDADVQDAVLALPPAWRLAVVLADVEGFAYREIADITGSPIGTVMSRLHRGRKQLAKSLAEYARAAGYVTEDDR
ncbi:MAG TPA: sigma-70 family RNA polymerase sigma factor [Thermomicrobiales bacterium]|nr:sigma-70 family RNA polymerase sigma factor [Thermomicrobiales bacterium]